jgi:hypothetical protein
MVSQPTNQKSVIVCVKKLNISSSSGNSNSDSDSNSHENMSGHATCLVVQQLTLWALNPAIAFHIRARLYAFGKAQPIFGRPPAAKNVSKADKYGWPVGPNLWPGACCTSRTATRGIVA